MRLRYTVQAARELDEVLEHIRLQAPSGARNVQARLRKIIDMLCIYPQGGRPTDLPNLRRMNVAPYPYAIFYRLDEGNLVIVSIRHTGRDPDSMPDRE